MAQVYRRVRLLVSPTIVGVQLTDQQRTAQAPMMACREEPSNTMTGWRRIRFPRVVPWNAQSVHLERL